MHGAPVITFIDPDGIIEREGLGFVVKDAQGLKDRIDHLARNPEVWAQFSARCYAFMDREFGEDRILRPYRELIDASFLEVIR